MINDVKDDPILQVSSQELSMSPKSQILVRSKSCRIFIKFSGYLPNHLLTCFMVSKMTPYLKSPVRNLQNPPSSKFRPDLIMSDLHQTFRISSYLCTDMIYDVKVNLILQVSSHEPSMSSKSQIKAGSKSYSDHHQPFRISF